MKILLWSLMSYLSFWSFLTHASKPQTQILSGYASLVAGDFENMSLSAEGLVYLGPQAESVAAITGTITAMATAKSGELYVATANPARLWLAKKGQEPAQIIELKEPLITSVVVADREIAVLAGPQGGVYFVKPGSKEAPRFVPVSEVDILLQGTFVAGTLYFAGGGEAGKLFKLRTGDDKPQLVATINDTHIRSLFADAGAKGNVIELGGGNLGTIYRWDNGKLTAIYDAQDAEVTSIVKDRQGRLFASLMARESATRQTVLPRPKALDSDGAEDKEEQKPVPNEPREVKFSQIVRIDKDGSTDILWQSSRDGAYQIQLSQGEQRLYFATGPRGILYGVDTDGNRGASLVWRQQKATEIASLVVGPSGNLIAAMAFDGGVYEIDISKRSKEGAYLTAPIDASSTARFGSVWIDNSADVAKGLEVWVRTGNTPKPDEFWSPWVKTNPAKGRYGQTKIVARDAGDRSPSFRQLQLAYLVDNRGPQIASLRVLPAGYRLEAREDEKQTTFNINFDAQAFSNVGSFVPSLTQPAKISQGIVNFDGASRTVFAYAEDPDQDVLRYRFALEKVANAEGPTYELQDWGNKPYVAFDTEKLAEGRYRVHAWVDDLLDNGPERAAKDHSASAIFLVSRQKPVFSAASAQKVKDGIRVKLTVTAKSPLVAIRCVTGQGEWVSLDAVDGLVDSQTESVNGVIPGKSWFDSISCQALDQDSQETQIAIAVR